MGNIIYICEPNCGMHKASQTISIRKNNQLVAAIPLIDIDVIVILGNVQITTQMLNTIFDSLIDVVFMKNNGQISGRINSQRANNIILRIAQFNKFKDEEQKLKISKYIVNSKIEKQIVLLKSYSKNDKLNKITENIRFINKTKTGIEKCSFNNEVMGIEGICAKKYFECFDIIIKGFKFERRQKRPAFDPINAMLNLGYAFLRNEINSRLNIFGFDLELGFLHGIRYGRESLSLDLMEEFRPMIIDKFIINLFNKKQITEEHFIIDENGCILNNDGMKKFIDEYHKHMAKDLDGTPVNKLLDKQVLKFKKSIMNGCDYETHE